MKPIDVKDNTYINIDKEVNSKDPKFKVGYNIRISKYKTFLLKAILQIGLKKSLLLKTLKIQFHGPVINDLNSKKIIGIFNEKGLQKTNQEVFRIEKVIKRKGDKLYVKWKGYDNSFNSWIDKKVLVK